MYEFIIAGGTADVPRSAVFARSDRRCRRVLSGAASRQGGATRCPGFSRLDIATREPKEPAR